jgi:hypothetical protein
MVVSTNTILWGLVVNTHAVLLVHAYVTPSTASWLSVLARSKRLSRVRQAPLPEEASSPNGEEDDALNRHETANATALSLTWDGASYSVADDNPTAISVMAADPLYAMGNLTERLASLTQQFGFHLDLAHDERGKLRQQLQESQQACKQLNSLVQELRSDKDAVEEELSRVVQEYESETQKRELEAQTLRTQASQDRKALKVEQSRVLALKHTVDEQEHYITRTETSSRHLLLLLGKLLLRRLERLIIYVFPFAARLIKSIFHFFAVWGEDEDTTEEAQSSDQKVAA